ncbi:MAG: GtrA family protein [Acutalibacteraceae bacterium]
MSESDSLIVLIPAYKPGQELLRLADELLGGGNLQIVVVNDGSGKEYDNIFSALPSSVTVLNHEINRGKGQALKTAFKYIGENYPDCRGIVTADADGQHRYKDIMNVASDIKESNCLVLGCRKFTGYVPFRSRFGNKLTRAVFLIATNKKLSDVQTGLRGFSPDLIPALLSIPGSRYEYEINMLLEAAQNETEIREVEIDTVYQPGNTSSHFSPIRDSIRIYLCILKYVMSSFTAFLIDYAAVLLFTGLFLKFDLGRSAAVSAAAVAARIISSFVNFIINRNLVFKNHENPLKTALKFYALVAFILLLNIGLLNITNVWLHIPLWIAKIIVELTLFVLNYVIQRKVVFKT